MSGRRVFGLKSKKKTFFQLFFPSKNAPLPFDPPQNDSSLNDAFLRVRLARRNGSECIAHLSRPPFEFFQAPLFLGLFKRRLSRIHIGLPFGQEGIDDPGQLVGRGHDPALLSQLGGHPAIVFAQGRAAVFQRAGCHAESLSHPVVALRNLPRDHLSSRDARSRRHSGPRREVRLQRRIKKSCPSKIPNANFDLRNVSSTTETWSL